MHRDENDVALTLCEKQCNDDITRSALDLTGQLNSKGHLNHVRDRILAELKTCKGTVLLPLGMSPTDGYVPSSDEEAKESEYDMSHRNYVSGLLLEFITFVFLLEIL